MTVIARQASVRQTTALAAFAAQTERSAAVSLSELFQGRNGGARRRRPTSPTAFFKTMPRASQQPKGSSAVGMLHCTLAAQAERTPPPMRDRLELRQRTALAPASGGLANLSWRWGRSPD